MGAVYGTEAGLIYGAYTSANIILTGLGGALYIPVIMVSDAIIGGVAGALCGAIHGLYEDYYA